MGVWDAAKRMLFFFACEVTDLWLSKNSKVQQKSSPTMNAIATRSFYSIVKRKRCRAFFSAALVILCASVSHDACAQFTFASDQASNYGGVGEPTFSNGQDGGSGFDAWSMTFSGNSGAFIGNPSTQGGITGMASEAFVLYANESSNSGATLNRDLETPLQVGDTFSFQWGINWDGNNGVNGNKGFSIFVGDTQIINVNNGGNANVTINTTNTGFTFGTSVMTWSFLYTNSTTLVVTANDRDGSGSYSNNFTVTGPVDAFRWYASNLTSDDGLRRPYYNQLSVTNSGVYYDDQTEGRALTGSGNLVVSNNSTLTLTANNNFTGTTTVQTGSTLKLDASGTGAKALGGTDSVSIGGIGAKLLISKSDQVRNGASVSLSGGTIELANGVTETFAGLNIFSASILDFGSGTTGTGNLSLGTYDGGLDVPADVLTINNFAPGNSFTFSNDSFLADGSNIGSYFTFGAAGFVNRSITDNGSGSFTITAIPEPSTYVAAAGLLAMFLWPVRRRMIKDLKSILGLRPTGRERIEAYRKA
jgi:hypothetical protein